MKNLWKKMAAAVALSVAVSAVMVPPLGSYAQEQAEAGAGTEEARPAETVEASKAEVPSGTEQQGPTEGPMGAREQDPSQPADQTGAKEPGQAEDPAGTGDPATAVGPGEQGQPDAPAEAGQTGALVLDDKSEHVLLPDGKDEGRYILLKSTGAEVTAIFTVPAGTAVHEDGAGISLHRVGADTPVEVESITVSESALTAEKAGTACQLSVKVSQFKNGTYWAQLQDGAGVVCKSAEIQVQVQEPYVKSKSRKLGESMKLSSVREAVENHFGKQATAGEVKVAKVNGEKIAGLNKDNTKIETKKYGKYGTTEITIMGAGANKAKKLGTITFTVEPEDLKVTFLNGKKNSYYGYADYDIKRIQIENIDKKNLKKGSKIKISFRKKNEEDKLLKKVSSTNVKDGTYVTDDIAIKKVKKGEKWIFTVTVEYQGAGKCSKEASWPK